MKKILFLFFLSFPAVAQIGAKVQQQKIYGIWQNSQFGYQMTLILQTDGTGEFDGESIKYVSQPGSLSITAAGVTTKYSYVLANNSLTLSGGDLDGKVVFIGNGAVAPAEKTIEAATAQTTAKPDKLLGSWSANGETIQFNSDRTCVYLGNTFQYQLSQENVTFITAQGNIVFAYTVKGNQLTLTANGKQAVYYKGQGAVTQTPSGKGVPQELVGQWCYMNMNTNSQTSRCITLNADGSYYYSYEGSRSVNTETLSGGTSSQNSDRGTWYVQGDRIYYNSQSSGQGSYRLEKRNHPKNVNDPMIVLDGEAYVTMTSRAPWR